MKHSSLESSHRGGSNGDKFEFLASIDGELDLLKRTHKISSSSDCKNMKRSSLKSPHQDGSNGGKIAFLALIDCKLALPKISIYKPKYIVIY